MKPIVEFPPDTVMIEVSMKTTSDGYENVTTQWFEVDEWKKVKEQGFYRD